MCVDWRVENEHWPQHANARLERRDRDKMTMKFFRTWFAFSSVMIVERWVTNWCNL